MTSKEKGQAESHEGVPWMPSSMLGHQGQCLHSSRQKLKPLILLSLSDPGTALANSLPWTSWRWLWPWPCSALSFCLIPPGSRSPYQDSCWSPRMGFIYVSKSSNNLLRTRIAPMASCLPSCLPVTHSHPRPSARTPFFLPSLLLSSCVRASSSLSVSLSSLPSSRVAPCFPLCLPECSSELPP